MTRFLILLLALLLALLVAGCIDYDEVLELNADGSGTLSMHLVIYKHSFEAFSQMMSSFGADSSQESSGAIDSAMFSMFKREDLEKKLKESKSGVKLLDFKEQRTDSTVIYDIRYAFNDIKEMLAISDNMGKEAMMGEPATGPEVIFSKDKSGSWHYTREFAASSLGDMMQSEPDTSTVAIQSPHSETNKPDDSFSVAMTQSFDTATAQMGSLMTGMAGMMTQAFANRTMRMTVKFPGTVVESNATKTSGNMTVWEYKFTDLSKAPKQLQAVIKP